MPQRRAFLLGAFATFARLSRASAEELSDDAIRAILRQQVDVGRHCTGIVAGVLEAAGRRLIAYGRPDTPGERPLDGDTVFPIASITKVFTAVLLADMVERGEVALTDPVAKYLPADVKTPERSGKQITLVDLATHTSGLPYRMNNRQLKDPANPFADYTINQLYDFVSGYRLLFDPGSHYEYSNLGFALLGHALSRRAGKSYEELVVGRICAPLGMDSTRITLPPVMRARMAQGHDDKLDPTPNWDFPTYPGTGAFCSTANDLFGFLDACLGRRTASLGPALEMTLATRRLGSDGMITALGWAISKKFGDEIVHKVGGGSGFGFACFVGFSTVSRQGCVVLSNGNDADTIGDIGRHMLNARYLLYDKS